MRNVWPQVRELFADGRFTANLIAFYGVGVIVLLAALIVRRILSRCRRHATDATEVGTLHRINNSVIHHCRALVFWLSLLALIGTVALGWVFHSAGRDVRHEIRGWYRNLTLEEVYRGGLALGALVALWFVTEFTVWMVRRLRPQLQDQAHCTVGCEANRDSLKVWFQLVESYAVIAVRIGATWGAGVLLGLGEVSAAVFGFLLRLMTIIIVARLMTLAVRALVHKAMELGNKHLSYGRLRRYWEHVGRLFFPFGQRCVETAVFVIAAAMCLHELRFTIFLSEFGPRIVHCIGILFGTRVLIELLQVLLNEAFGLYDNPDVLDAKGRTLVPLLQSFCQYVLYFGSGVIMLGVLGVDTRPILAGAGILGLAVGLGAQNLVTDVVSGFFILFENQYLVGDYVQIGEAIGTVEGVSVRLTQVRDGHGKLYIIPNGQIKSVVNYSKGFVNAVVDVKVPSGSDLDNVFRNMADAGRRLQQAHREVVLAETHVHGLVDLGTEMMTVRAVTKVQPGAHGQMQSEYRRMLKQVFDQQRQLERPRVAA